MALGLVRGITLREFVAGFTVTTIAIAVSFATVGALIAARQPRNLIGWVFAASGLLNGLELFLAGYSWYALTVAGWPGGHAAAWAAGWMWVPGYAFLPLALLVFPDGRLPSSRWQPAAWFVLLVGAANTAAAVLSPEPRNPGLPPFDAPFQFEALGSITDLVWGWSSQAFMLALLVAVAAMVVRFRRADGTHRQQLKVIAYAAPVSLLGVIVFSWTAVAPVTNGLFVAAIPAAIGVSVLKYHLYDIDLVISKTLVFAGLAGFITAAYVGIVVGVGSLVGARGEPDLGLSIAATAVVAVAFQPVRERLQRLANRLVYGVRATPYEVLSRFSSDLGQTADPDAVLARMARLLAEGTGAARAQVWVRVGGRLQVAAVHPEQATAESDPLPLTGEKLPDVGDADLAVAVSHEGELLGALSVSKQRGETVTPTDHKLVSDLAAQAGLVLRNVRLTAELRQRLVDLHHSRRRLVEAQDAERRRLERDLHDGAQQQLVALKLKLNLAKTFADREQAEKTAQLLDGLSGEADDAVQTLRELAHGIYPPLLAAEGLAAALQAQARKAAVPVTIEADGVGRYPAEVEAAVYFSVLEAVQNAAKYAQADTVTARLHEADGQLTFDVADDGVGFDPATTAKGHGLTNIADRLDALGGTLSIVSRPGTGTTIRCRLPILPSHTTVSDTGASTG